MIYPEELIEEVRLRNDITDVVSGYVRLERKGRRLFGLCPFHNEKSPSFSVDPDKQLFYCFGCNKGGSTIQFIMFIENLEFLEAIKLLAERAGITLPEPEDSKERQKAGLKKEILAINREAARFFFSTLAGKAGLEAQQYLKGRALQEKTIKQFGLGFSPHGWRDLTQHLLSKGTSEDVLQAAGLSLKAKNGDLVDRFRGRVMFPIFDIRGNIIGFGGRVIDGSQPKYMNSPDTLVYNKSRELYGLNFARMSASKRLLMVEGYMDVISLHQAGIDYAVASLGTALTQNQAWILKKYSSEVIIGYDSDSAGQAATMRGLEILEQAGCSVRVLVIPEGKDPDEYLRKSDPEKFKILVDRAISLLDYRIRAGKQMHNVDNIDDKLKLLNSIAETLAKHENSIEREIYAKNYAQEYGISLESLQNEIARKIRGYSKNKDYSRNNRGIQSGERIKIPAMDKRYGELEYMLLILLSYENRLFGMVSEKYPIESFKDEGAKSIAVKLYERLKESGNCVAAELLNGLEPALASQFMRISETRCDFEDPEKAIKQLLNRLELYKLEDEQMITIERIKNEQDGQIRQTLGIEFSKRAERIAGLKKMA